MILGTTSCVTGVWFTKYLYIYFVYISLKVLLFFHQADSMFLFLYLAFIHFGLILVQCERFASIDILMCITSQFFSAVFVIKSIFSPVYVEPMVCLSEIRWFKVLEAVCILYSIPLFNTSFRTVACCSYYDSFIVKLEVWNCNAICFALAAQDFLAILGLFWFHVTFFSSLKTLIFSFNLLPVLFFYLITLRTQLLLLICVYLIWHLQLPLAYVVLVWCRQNISAVHNNL